MSEQTEKAVNIAQKVHDILQKNVPEDWLPSGIDRNYYLDIIERIVRTAEPWVDNNGAVIDPVLKYEHGQTSPRFASSCAVAIYFGRCMEFKEKLLENRLSTLLGLTDPGRACDPDEIRELGRVRPVQQRSKERKEEKSV